MNWADIELLALDFDGVFTDNRVSVDEHGNEWVTCSRGDGEGIAKARQHLSIVVISAEKHPVASARCRKLQIPIHLAVEDKLAALKELNYSPEQVAYVGNDLRDIPCIEWAGIGIAVADAFPEVLDVADYVCQNSGGYGAVREVCERLLKARGKWEVPRQGYLENWRD